MPEGHTLHKAARNQRPVLVAQKVRATSPQGRFVDAIKLDGARIVAIEAYGKHLFYEVVRRKRRQWLHVHLGLAGRFKIHKSPPPSPRGSVRLRLQAETHTLDLRGPLICEIVDEKKAKTIIEKLGPDPIRARTTAARVRKRLSRSRVPIGAMLLDQSVIAGVGNVYRAELLFLGGIDPRRQSRSLTEAEVATLWRLARQLLRAGVTDGRIVTTRYATEIVPLYPKQRTFAYKQRSCARCRGGISQVKLAGRTCFFCPRCQT